MSEKIVVVALGHRALGTTLPEQKIATQAAAKAVADLVEDGAKVVISHSNGPQIGMIHTAMNEFGKAHPDYTFAPMSVCSAMSQGYIGYDLQNAIRTEFIKRGIYKPVATVLTQTVIDPYDDAFADPEKIIGRVLTEEEAEAEEEKGNFVTKLPDGGYRRIVAAPKPQKIVEIETVRALLNADQVVIAAGGGGIPVLEQGINLHGASAIIEKDLAAGLLAEELNADTLLILTSVENVSLNLGKADEQKLGSISAADAKKYMPRKDMKRKLELSFDKPLKRVPKGFLFRRNKIKPCVHRHFLFFMTMNTRFFLTPGNAVFSFQSGISRRVSRFPTQSHDRLQTV